MRNLLFLLMCLMLGTLAQRAGRFPIDAHKTINALIVQIAMPALIFCNIHPLTLDLQMLWVVVMPWLLYVLAIVFFGLAGWLYGWDRRTVGTLAITAGFGNLSFIGLPMIEAFYGSTWLGVGAISAQLGVNVATNTAGVMTAAYCGSRSAFRLASVARRIALYPPFQAFVLALMLKPVEMPPEVLEIAGRLGMLVAPLAMLTIGAQLSFSGEKSEPGTLGAALLFKLAVAPAVALGIVYWLAKLNGPLAQIIIFQAALGPQVAGAIISSEFELDTRLSALVIGLGTLMSMLSVCVWHAIAIRVL